MVLALIFACATLSVFILSAAYWNVGLGNFATATRLQHAGGVLAFISGVSGWYATFTMMAVEVGFPIKFPVGDLSRFWPRPDVDLERLEKRD